MRVSILESTTQISRRPCLFWGIAVPSGDGSGSVQVFNQTVEAGESPDEESAVIPPITNSSQTIVLFPKPVICNRGLYVNTNTTVYVYWE